jgi:hypothetical protein
LEPIADNAASQPEEIATVLPADSDSRDDESERRFAKRRKGWSSKTIWLVVGLGVGVPVAVMLGLVFVFVILQSQKPAPQGKLGNEMRFGDLGVNVYRAKVEGFTSTSAIGRPMVHNSKFVVQIELKNYNRNRVICVAGQSGHATLRDDVGNTYDEMRATNEIGVPNTIDGQIGRGNCRDVRSEGPQRDVVVFDLPVEGASYVILTIDLSQYYEFGGAGKLEFKLPRSGWALN